MKLGKTIFTHFKIMFCILIMATCSLTTFACDMHGSRGFGFGMYEPKPQKWQASPVDSAPKIKLKYPFVTKISTAELSDISIEYTLPFDVDNATLEIKSSNMLALKSSNTLPLSKEGGVYAIQVEAEENGQHILTLNVNALQNSRPVSLVRRIFVNAQTANKNL